MPLFVYLLFDEAERTSFESRCDRALAAISLWNMQTCSVYMQYMQCTCMQCSTCSVYMQYMQCIHAVHAVYTCSTCSVHAPYMHAVQYMQHAVYTCSNMQCIHAVHAVYMHLCSTCSVYMQYIQCIHCMYMQYIRFALETGFFEIFGGGLLFSLISKQPGFVKTGTLIKRT